MNLSTTKQHIISAVTTFISTFVVFASFQINQPGFIFTKEGFASLIISALVVSVRAIIKLITEWHFGTPVVSPTSTPQV
jgi:hypothetical protein